MARPSIQATFNLGAVNPSGFPASGADRFLDHLFMFSVNFPSDVAVFPGRTINYAAWIYHAIDNGGAYNNYAIAVYDITNNVLKGSSYLEAVLISAGTTTCQMASACGPISTANATVTIAAGGASYAVNDTIHLGGSVTPFQAAILKVTGVSTGAVTSVSVQTPGIYPGGVPSNPVPQASSSGSGTGATFNLTWDSNYGIVYQCACTGISYGFAGINATTNTYMNVFDNSSLTQRVPEDTVASVTNLSGYNFVLSSTGNVWNTLPGDCFDFNDLSFTQAFSDAGTAPITLSFHAGFLVALGNSEIRLFYVTGAINGSSVAPSLYTAYGIGAYGSDFVDTANEYLGFVGSPDSLGYPVYMFSPNSQIPERVSYPYLENLLLSSYTINRAAFLNFRGHWCFSISTTQGPIFLYDTLTKLWYQWTPFATDQSYALTVNATFANKTFSIGYDVASSHFYLMNLAAAGTDLKYGSVASTYYPIANTPALDFETMNKKTWGGATVICDQTASSMTCGITYSDDEGNNFVSPARTVDLSSSYPNVRDLGQSRRRMWQIQIPANPLARIDGIELSYEIGPT